MPITIVKIASVLLLLARALGARAEDANPKLAAQKQAARENWSLLEIGEPAVHETAHLLILASGSLENRLKDIGALLEKHYTAAEKALKLDPRKELWPGKLTVYLFAEREPFTTFVRRVEKRRLDPELASGQAVEGDLAHVFTGPPRARQAGSLDLLAAEEVASALLQRKAGPRVVLPDWLLFGFGRATTWRTTPNDDSTRKARQQALRLVAAKKRTVQDVWNGVLDPDEAQVLRPALADLLAYGPGVSRFPSVVIGFRPDSGEERKTPEQALEAAGLKVDNLARVWPDFVRNPR